MNLTYPPCLTATVYAGAFAVSGPPTPTRRATLRLTVDRWPVCRQNTRLF